MKTLTRLIFNWLFILSSPIWVLPVFMTVALVSLFKPGEYPQYFNVATGRSWIL